LSYECQFNSILNDRSWLSSQTRSRCTFKQSIQSGGRQCETTRCLAHELVSLQILILERDLLSGFQAEQIIIRGQSAPVSNTHDEAKNF